MPRLVFALVLLAACVHPPPTLEARLGALAVTDDDYARPVLYTWTTPASIRDLRASHVLLVATARSGGFTSPFNRALRRTAARKGKGRAIAILLATHPALIHRRYAWPSPFATVLGVGRRTYGNALIRIELRPEAWIGRYEPSSPDPFAFVDARGRPVATDDVLAAPERIGAIFHVRLERGIPVPFREYIVCNAGMVASWSIATPAIRAELDAEIALLTELGTVVAAWSRAQRDRWDRAVAFYNERYRPEPARLDAIVAALRAYDPAGAPLTVTPTPPRTRPAAPPTPRARRRRHRPAS
jgi:hypothetical protein